MGRATATPFVDENPRHESLENGTSGVALIEPAAGGWVGVSGRAVAAPLGGIGVVGTYGGVVGVMAGGVVADVDAGASCISGMLTKLTGASEAVPHVPHVPRICASNTDGSGRSCAIKARSRSRMCSVART